MANYNVSGLITLAELAKTKKDNWVVYILKCRDGSLYTGITNNISKRIIPPIKPASNVDCKY